MDYLYEQVLKISQNIITFTELADTTLEKMKNMNDSRLISDCINIVIIRNEMINLSDYALNGAIMLPLFLGDQNTLRYVKGFYVSFRKAMITLYDILDSANVTVDITNSIIESAGLLADQIFELFDATTMWDKLKEVK